MSEVTLNTEWLSDCSGCHVAIAAPSSKIRKRPYHAPECDSALRARSIFQLDRSLCGRAIKRDFDYPFSENSEFAFAAFIRGA